MLGAGAVTLRNGDKISFTLKCIVISLLLALLYWFAPSKNKWVLLAILYLTYLALAWYDHLYDCRRKALQPTFLYSFYGALKPRAYQEAYEEWQPSTKRLVAGVDLGILGLLLLGLPFFLRWRPGC